VITVTRSLIRQFRAVVRRALVERPVGGINNRVVFRSGSDGLRIQVTSPQVAIEVHQPGEFETEELIVPAEFLADAEGRSHDAITLESQGHDKVLASWTDRGIPQMIRYDSPADRDSSSKIPPLPEAFEPNSPELLTALRDAVKVTPRERTRFALDHLQLRGTEGKIIATDGQQVLVQGGFHFPWPGDLLVPALPVFDCQELPRNEQLGVGLVDDWVALQIGHWTIWLAVDREGRFPKVDDLFQKPSAASSRVSIETIDAEVLVDALPRLPCDDPAHQSITLDLNGRVVVRARPEGQTRPTELILSRSTLTGESLAISTNRAFLASALKLGFREICFFGATAPALCDDGGRQYLWALLDPNEAIRPSVDAIQVESLTQVTSQKATPVPPTRRRFKLIHSTTPSTTGPSVREARQAGLSRPLSEPETTSSIARALALRAVVREVLAHTNELIRVLKREKRQSRLVASTLASLKQLQKVAG